MNEEIFEETAVDGEDISEQERLSRELAQMQSENAYLRAKCVCAEMGIPKGVTEDIITLGNFYAQRDGVDFAEAAQAAYARICASGGITTGVALEKKKEDYSALRRAFGLSE